MLNTVTKRVTSYSHSVCNTPSRRESEADPVGSEDGTRKNFHTGLQNLSGRISPMSSVGLPALTAPQRNSFETPIRTRGSDGVGTVNEGPTAEAEAEAVAEEEGGSGAPPARTAQVSGVQYSGFT